MKKIAGFKKVLDGFNHSLSHSDDRPAEPEVNQSLDTEKFTLAKVGRYGFPYHATCLALDSVQKLLAIGTANGAIRICGKPGVEFHVNHETNAAVSILLFLINEGGLVSVCNDSSLHIWSIRQKEPALIHSLNFKKERITALHNPFGSKWLYAGTERGNVYIVHVETFKVSGYVISWNHVIDVSCKTHPGPVVEISSNPSDQNKLLLSFESGVCILWDLRSKKSQFSYSIQEASQYVTCAVWHSDGRQFMTGHWDGSLSTWNYRNPKKPDERQMPHSTGKSNSKEKDGICCPVTKLEWLPGKVGELPVVIFSGGMPYGNKNKGLTIMRGRSKTLLLQDYVVDFKCLVSTSASLETPEPQALYVLLSKEIVVFDLLETKAPSLPWFSVPYTFDIHESPVTCLQLYSECPSDFLTCLHSMQLSHHKEPVNRSKHPWPLTGGTEGEMCREASIIMTGHADGTIKFWDATTNLLIPCYKLSISRLFERYSRRPSTNSESEQFDDPFALQHICLCPYGRVIAVVCQSYFLAVFKFSNQENIIETVKIDVNFSLDMAQELSDSPTSADFPLSSDSFSADPEILSQKRSSIGSLTIYHPPFRTTGIKWPVGFQPEVVCQQLAYEPLPNITVLTVSSAYGLVAFGNTIGVAIIDYVQKTTVIAILNHELGVAGEWTDPINNAYSPMSPTILEKDLPNGYTDSKDKKSSNDKKKERMSRMLTSEHSHPKLSKKGSTQSVHSQTSNGRDTEDGVVNTKDKKEREETSAGWTGALNFAYTYTRKLGTLMCPSIWIGTSKGAVAVITLSVPPTGKQRYIQPVLALCAGTIMEVHHSILKITHLDTYGNIFVSPFDCWKDKENLFDPRNNIQTSNTETNERHFVCIATEKQILVKTLPSTKSFAAVEPVPENAYIVRADSMIIECGNTIGCLTTDGSLKIYCLPSLTLMLDVECDFSLADFRLIRTFALSKGGEAIFLASPTEIQRLAFTKEKEERFVDDHGCLFTLCQLPEPKPKGFFESFFSAGPSPLDREELFGPKSGSIRKVADYTPGSGLGSFRGQADTAAGAIGKAKMALIERGEKLSQIEDRAAEMNYKASSFASASRALAEKYQRKKWYQL